MKNKKPKKQQRRTDAIFLSNSKIGIGTFPSSSFRQPRKQKAVTYDWQILKNIDKNETKQNEKIEEESLAGKNANSR